MRVRTDAAIGGRRDPGCVRRCPVIVLVDDDGAVDVVALVVVDDHPVVAPVRPLVVVGGHSGGKDREEQGLEGRRSPVESPEGPHGPKMMAADPEVKAGAGGTRLVDGRRRARPGSYGRLSATSAPGIGTTIR